VTGRGGVQDETDPPVPGKEMLSELAKTEHG